MTDLTVSVVVLQELNLDEFGFIGSFQNQEKKTKKFLLHALD